MRSSLRSYPKHRWPMDRKTAGITDIVANLVTEDEELHKAAIQIRDKRNGETKRKPPNAVQPSQPGPKLVSAPKKVKIGESRVESKQPIAQRASKKPSVERTWSNPTATLNTRIPPEMDQLLDDQVAKQKREWKLNRQQGAKPTKQMIVQAALAKYFKSNKL